MNPNYKLTEEIQQIYQCQVCRNLLLNPIALTCGHSYCKTCVDEIRRSSIKKCPTCRKPIREEEVLQQNFMLKNIISKLRCKCILCGKQDVVGIISEHLCPEVKLPCKNRGCNEEIKRKMQAQHKEICPFRKILCERCGEKFRFQDIEEHNERQCGSRVGKCPLGCKEKLKRDELYMHSIACKNKIKECKVPGCHVKGNRDTLKNHEDNVALKHVALLDAHSEAMSSAFEERKNIQTDKLSEGVESFTWIINNDGESREKTNEKIPFTSPKFKAHGGLWRLMLFPDNRLYIQLVSSVRPIGVGLRMLMSSNIVMTKQYIFCKEGETYGNEVPAIGEINDTLEIKVILDRVKVKVGM